MTEAASSEAAEASERVSPRAWYALFVLVLMFMVSLTDRSIITMLIGSIKTDLSLDDFQVSLLMGTAFGICYVLFATPFGWAADRFPRPIVLAFGLAFWSLACMSGGFASTFVGLFVSRMAVGAGEACLSPSAYPLMSELFPRRRLPTAMALYHLGGSLGASVSLIIGGLVASMAMKAGTLHVPLFGELRPWQMAFVIVGVAGLPAVILALTLPEPRKARVERKAKTAPVALAPFLKRHRRLIFCHHLGFATGTMVTYGTGFWIPEFLVRKFGWDIAYVGSMLGAMVLATGFIGQFMAVQVMGYFTRHGHKDAVMRGYIYVMIVGALFSALAYTASNPVLTVAGLLVANSAITPVLTFGGSALQLFTPIELRGRLSGLFISTASLMGLGIAPSIVGGLTEYVLGGKEHIGTSLLIFSVGAQLTVIALLAWGLAPARRAMEEVAQG